jgi:hypothetical protein
MKLLIRRNQNTSGLLSKTVTFSMDVRADLSEEERDHIKKYKLGDTMLYESHPMTDRGSGLLGAASRFAHKALTISVSVNDLASGKHIEFKDIMEMIAVEEYIKDAARNFMDVLRAAAGFGGEEVLEI